MSQLTFGRVRTTQCHFFLHLETLEKKQPGLFADFPNPRRVTFSSICSFSWIMFIVHEFFSLELHVKVLTIHVCNSNGITSPGTWQYIFCYGLTLYCFYVFVPPPTDKYAVFVLFQCCVFEPPPCRCGVVGQIQNSPFKWEAKCFCFELFICHSPSKYFDCFV